MVTSSVHLKEAQQACLLPGEQQGREREPFCLYLPCQAMPWENQSQLQPACGDRAEKEGCVLLPLAGSGLEGHVPLVSIPF